MTATLLAVAAWAAIVGAVRFCLLARSHRETNWPEAHNARGWAMMMAFAAVVLGILTTAVAFADAAYVPFPAPSPQPSCAQYVSFPDSVPPRYGVCVSAEEAG